jgi:hypothetical protein
LKLVTGLNLASGIFYSTDKQQEIDLMGIYALHVDLEAKLKYTLSKKS